MNGLKIKFRPLTYKELNQVGIEQFSIQRTFGEIENIQDENVKAQKTKEALQVVTETTMKLVATAIEHIDIGNDNLVTDKNFIIDYLQNCDKNVYTQLRDYTAHLRDEAQIPPLQITCPNCSNVYQQPFTLNMSDFFG
jgi:predicted Ser/Thr protein kinase